MLERPVIPRSEYPERWHRVQAALQQAGLDLLIAYADDHAVAGPAHTRWLFNFAPHFEPACALIPALGDPVLLTGPESVEYAQAAAVAIDVRCVKEFTHPDEEYLYTTITTMEAVLADFARQAERPIRRVGLAGLELMPYKFYRALESHFGAPQMADAENLLIDLRKVKSPAEQAVIAYAYRIAEAGMAACLSAVAEGRTERELAAAAEHVMRNMGSEGMGIDTIVAAGREHNYPILARTTLRKVVRNDLVLFTIAPRYEGYHGAIGRPVVVGQPEPAVRTAMEAAIAAQQAGRAAVRPGAVGRDVETAARAVLRDYGLEQHFVYSGVHSVGVVEFEPPILTSASTEVLQPGMVLSIDIPIFFAPWGGLRYEDGFLVEAKGNRPLQEMTPAIITV